MDDIQTGTNDLPATIDVRVVQVKYVFCSFLVVGSMVDLFFSIGICLLLLFQIETVLLGLVR